MKDIFVTESVKYVGVDDTDIDLFESQYPVPNGISYNSYVIMDEKIAIMDTVDRRKTDEWLANVDEALEGRLPDYLVVHHMEPDHAGNIQILCKKFPNMKIVANKKLIAMLPQFFDMDFSEKLIEVGEGDTLSLGKHTLTFVMAPMVHWPEAMVSYESADKILFSADGFGKFGALSCDEDWTCEARRYFINIVGKYGAQVQALLKKAAGLDIAIICPLHGPILKENLGYYIEKYDIWSSYRPEDEGVLIAYGSIHGHTAAAAKKMAEILTAKGCPKVVVCDLARDSMSEAIEDAYRYSKLIIASATYDANLFPCVEDYVYHLKIKNFQKRKVGIIQNGSWAPAAGKLLKEAFEKMKDITICETMVDIRSAMKQSNIAEMEALADEILA